MIKNILVIHHANCDDGFAAAWVLHKQFGEEAEYLPANYGDAAPDVANKVVYIVDFSYSPNVVRDMASVAKKLVLLDHHKTALEAWLPARSSLPRKWSANTISGDAEIHFDMDRSGARMAWDYFHAEEPPMLIRHIMDNDLWKHEMAGTKSFIRALRSYPQDFDLWDDFAKLGEHSYAEAYIEFIREGSAIERFVQQQCEYLIRVQGMRPVVLWRGSDAQGLSLCAPATFASELGHKLAEASGTFGMVYTIKQGQVYCSLRSVGDFDVSKIAQAYGGGGHKSAAAFTASIGSLEELLS